MDETNSTDRKIIQEMIEIFPQALQFLEKEGRLKEWMVLLTLLKDCKFAMDHIAHDLFMDVVKWYSLENTSSMQYSEKV